jgi:hypothetical protein
VCFAAMLKLQSALAAVAVLSVVLQAVVLPFARAIYLALSPLHSLCCLILFGLIHPRFATMNQRWHALTAAGTQITSMEGMLRDPVLAGALHMPPPPPPFKQTCAALLLCTLADLCEGLRTTFIGAGASAPWCEAAHEGLAALAATCFFLASIRPRPPASSWYSACWGWLAAAFGGGQLQNTLLFAGLACFGARAQLRGLASDGAIADAVGSRSPTAAAALGALLFARALACSALASQGVGSLLTWMTTPTEYWQYVNELTMLGADRSRLLAQAAGGVLLATPSALRVALAPVGGGFLALGLSKVGVALLTLAAWMAFFPLPSELLDSEGEPVGKYASLEEMRAARRAAREANAKRRAELPPPLLVDSSAGGVQGLRWHDLAFCRDPDGDEAHDFWEAVSGGCFRRCAFISS